ncbi:P-loop containing nucleoside triphosphate hydrolase protein [Xylariaceae sp. FL0804]|nr:P-loop containing nucleoside triphosphate hydrolase protein [Xylariaceae sp. FL0804]
MSRAVDKLPEPTVVREKKVIVLSFGRNGTMGLFHALEMLGYHGYHMASVMEHGAPHLNVLSDGIEAKFHGRGQPYGRAEFDRWLAPYDALLDMTSFFAPELVAAYPDARFVLTHRDPAAWVRSVNGTLLRMVRLVRAPPFAVVARLLSSGSSFAAALARFISLAPRTLWGDAEPGTDEAAVRTYREQNALVQKLVPADRLLVVKLEDGLGWEQICPFLGHEIPADPYPRGNDPREFGKLTRRYLQRGLLPVLAAGVAVVVAVVASGVFYGRT